MRGPTAYFLFSEEQRAATKAELVAAGAKAGVAQVAAAVGKKWGALSDAEKQQYKERAQQLKEEAVAAAQEQGSPGGEGDAAGGEGGDAQQAAGGAGGAAPPPPFGFPTGLVKRIITVDDEVQRVSADAVRAIAKATELFVQQLAVRALQHAQAGKRKNFKAADVAHIAGRDRRLLDMGLKDILDEMAAAAGGGTEEENAAAKRASKRQKQDEAAAAGTRQITSFFGVAAS